MTGTRIVAGSVLAFVLMLTTAPSTAGERQYRVSPGDTLSVRVHGHEDLSGEVTVSADGAVRLPLVDRVRVAGRTVAQAEARLAAAYRPDYLTDPSITVLVERTRPVYVLGEVEEPGRYDYERGLTVMESVALAGGYSYRADSDDIAIVRHGREKPRPAGEDARVLPGDTVRVGQRFF